MLLTDVQPYDSDVLHLSISTKIYCWNQFLSNGGNLFVHMILFIEYYGRMEKWVVNAACKFVKPVPGLIIITTTNESSKYQNPFLVK